ncbi:MAG: hypothetical protein ACYDGO_14600 [Smithellaceae bacterium]
MQLKIETIKKKAIVFFPENTQLNGCFFVSAIAAFHEGGELITELLAKDRNYIPFETDQGEILLLRKENMMMVLLEEEDDVDNYMPGYKQVTVDIHLLTGKVISGRVSFALPETHSRLSDFLNSRDAFFRMEVEGKNYLVQNKFVKMISAEKSG